MVPMSSDRCRRDSLRDGARRHRPVTPILEWGVSRNAGGTPVVGRRSTSVVHTGETPAFPGGPARGPVHAPLV